MPPEETAGAVNRKGESLMAKIFGVTPVELLDVVKGEDFERFWLNEFVPLGLKLGWTSHLLKADRGERAGKYAVIWELPSVESRDRIMPAPGQISEQGQQLLGPDFQRLGAKLDTFITGWPYTDYVELGK
jgi:hypothetical protein